MVSVIKNYLVNLWLVITNKPIIVVKQEVVQVPFSREQIYKLRKTFPHARARADVPHDDLLINEGQLQVLEFIENWGKKGGMHATRN